MYKRQTGFDPERSKKNTCKWLVYPEAAEDVAYIERELPAFIYDYETQGIEA